MIIDSFRGQYRFLSNFYPAKVLLDNIEYPTVEHAYQAAKTTDLILRQQIKEAPTPGKARKLGKSIEIKMSVPAWDCIRTSIMYKLLQQKFSDPKLHKMLLDTGDAELVEGNWWNDTFWGKYKGEGKNVLGVLLMLIRDECKL